MPPLPSTPFHAPPPQLHPRCCYASAITCPVLSYAMLLPPPARPCPLLCHAGLCCYGPATKCAVLKRGMVLRGCTLPQMTSSRSSPLSSACRTEYATCTAICYAICYAIRYRLGTDTADVRRRRRGEEEGLSLIHI
eukprot:2851489-Rhodomonas_salina.1